VFVDALERLNYGVESLLAGARIRRADLDDPDARVPCAAWGRDVRQALALRPMKNVGMRLAMVTPFGAFPLIDYLIALVCSCWGCTRRPLLVAQEVAREPTKIRLRWRSTGCMGVTSGGQWRRLGIVFGLVRSSIRLLGIRGTVRSSR
jgi:hypothetical protein